MNLIERFRALLRSDASSHGYVQPVAGDPKGKAWTVEQPLKDSDYTDHMSGKRRLGLVPTSEEGVSWFGAVDVDQHDEGKFVDFPSLEAALADFPVVIAQSRRKGAHVYVFGKEPLPTELFRQYLAIIAKTCKRFGDPIEVFPKQNRVSGTNQGAWLNLPYFDVENGHCYAIKDTQPLSLEEFLDLAESKRITVSQLRDFVGTVPIDKTLPNMAEAPPCIVSIIDEGGAGEGYRNNFIYALVVLCKKAKFTKAETMDALRVWNQTAIHPEVPIRELEKTVNRLAEEGEHNYLCDQDPLCSHCDKEACGKRLLGWKKAIFVDHIPTRAELVKKLQIVKSEPPKYILTMLNDMKVTLDAEELVNSTKVRVRVMQQADTILPMLKAATWDNILKMLFAEREFLPAPMAASEDMALVALLYDWCKQAEEVDGRGNPHLSLPDDLRKGGPIVMKDVDTGAPRTYFMPEHLERELKRRKVIGYSGRDMWTVLSRHGCTHEKLSNGVEAWSKPFTPYTPNLEVPSVQERF